MDTNICPKNNEAREDRPIASDDMVVAERFADERQTISIIEIVTQGMSVDALRQQRPMGWLSPNTIPRVAESAHVQHVYVGECLWTLSYEVNRDGAVMAASAASGFSLAFREEARNAWNAIGEEVFRTSCGPGLVQASSKPLDFSVNDTFDGTDVTLQYRTEVDCVHVALVVSRREMLASEEA